MNVDLLSNYIISDNYYISKDVGFVFRYQSSNGLSGSVDLKQQVLSVGIDVTDDWLYKVAIEECVQFISTELTDMIMIGINQSLHTLFYRLISEHLTTHKNERFVIV